MNTSVINNIFIKIVLILLITLIFLIITECALRIVYKDDVQNPFNSYIFAFEFNKHYLIDLKPNVYHKYINNTNNKKKIVKWRTNSRSYRGNELLSEPEYRIIVYGDSNIQAITSELEQTYPFQLETMLRAQLRKDIEVINAGIVGFGPDQSYLKFKREVDLLNPDLVIFHIFADNDYGDIIRNRLVYLNDSGDLSNTGFNPELDHEIRLSRKLQAVFSSLFFVKKTKELALLNNNYSKENSNISLDDRKRYLVQWLINRSEEEYELYKNNLPRKFSHFDDHYDIDIAMDPDAASSKTKIALMNTVMTDLVKFADQKGIKIIFLIQPSIIDITSDNYILNFEYLEQQSEKYKSDNLTSPIDRSCKKYKLNCINLYDIFRLYNPNKLYYDDLKDNHWNNLGQSVAAKHTASYIINNRIIK